MGSVENLRGFSEEVMANVFDLLESDSDDATDDYVNLCSTLADSSSDSSEGENGAHATVEDFLTTITKYSDADFKSHFRLNRTTAYYLIERYSESPFIPDDGNGRRSRVGAPKEIFIFLWYVSNTATFREIANLFGVAKSSAWGCVRRVAQWLISIGHEFVKWPQGSSANDVAANFERVKHIPGIIGAIDCTHIQIKAPTQNKTSYFDRKRKYSIILQAVVDADKKFTDIFVGEPGSLHDSRVLRRSSLYRRATTNRQETFPGDTFLIGDSAYASSSWLVSPFKNFGTLSDSQEQFNNLHSSARMVVENAFGLLKNRFRRILHFTEQSNICSITNIVTSTCVLHNICIVFNDEIIQQSSPAADVHSGSPSHDISSDRRQQLFDLLLSRRIIS